MKEYERNLFAINGISGMLLLTILLLSIVVFLTIKSISVQKNNAKNFYMIKNAHLIKKISIQNAKHIVLVK